jgi:hypothetical protein
MQTHPVEIERRSAGFHRDELLRTITRTRSSIEAARYAVSILESGGPIPRVMPLCEPPEIPDFTPQIANLVADVEPREPAGFGRIEDAMRDIDRRVSSVDTVVSGCGCFATVVSEAPPAPRADDRVIDAMADLTERCRQFIDRGDYPGYIRCLGGHLS